MNEQLVQKGVGWARSMVWSVFLTVVVVLVMASLRGGPMAVTQAPPLTGFDLRGQPVNLADLRGKPVVLYFWATWCPACKISSPIVDQFARSHPDVTVLGVAVDDEAEVRAYLQEHERTFRVLRTTEAIERGWPIRALPTTVVVDRAGQIAWQRVGVLLPGELNVHVD